MEVLKKIEKNFLDGWCEEAVYYAIMSQFGCIDHYEIVESETWELAKLAAKWQFPVNEGARTSVFKEACRYGPVELIESYLDAGFDMHMYDDVGFRCACSERNLEVVQFLIDEGANLIAHQEEAGRWAIRFKNEEKDNRLFDILSKYPEARMTELGHQYEKYNL